MPGSRSGDEEVGHVCMLSGELPRDCLPTPEPARLLREVINELETACASVVVPTIRDNHGECYWLWMLRVRGLPDAASLPVGANCQLDGHIVLFCISADQNIFVHFVL